MEKKARAVGINHVALEVGDIEEALRFYGELFDLRLRGREEKMAFIELGDQFIALFEGRTQKRDEGRHFGLVVDDRRRVNQAVDRLGSSEPRGAADACGSSVPPRRWRAPRRSGATR